MAWKIEKLMRGQPDLKEPILIEGLPGIGNVGKVVVDFIIEELKAKKLFEISSYSFPHSVFVNEDNLVELPMIEVYYKKFKNKKHDLLLLTGDVQPQDEVSSYEFSNKMIDMVAGLNGKEIITLGGIGLPSVSKKPKVYCTGNNKDLIKKYKKGTAMNDKLYGIVGPIVGVSGLMLGIAGKRKIPGIALLAETYAHPMYLGLDGAREIIKILNKKLSLGLDIHQLEREIKEIEEELIKKTKELGDVSKKVVLKKLKGKFSGKDVNYIG